ncbi:AraC family transcriptional regulator [Mesorhizobium muleiense]|uniref:AraC family transcriptional regulator n=1 Tax=Mesorhizobium muleiense TaxID=1004279 RepID=UPI002E37E2A4|nr:AraC family transcriptional regulator [Mesorhizobium muleiense]
MPHTSWRASRAPRLRRSRATRSPRSARTFTACPTEAAGRGRCCFLAACISIDGLHPLLGMMPDVMRAHELEAYEPGIPHLLEAMAREVTMERVGSGGILARLADVLAATVIRSWVERGCGDSSGWIAAVRDREIGRVLAAIHLEPDLDWTVETLARMMGASRSGFAERFATIVGETPAKYVTQVRMHQARQWLVRDRLKISVVAARLGYESDASFSRAFKRVIGSAPSHFRAEEQAETRQAG